MKIAIANQFELPQPQSQQETGTGTETEAQQFNNSINNNSSSSIKLIGNGNASNFPLNVSTNDVNNVIVPSTTTTTTTSTENENAACSSSSLPTLAVAHESMSTSTPFLEFKEKAEQLISMVVKFSHNERLEAATFWTNLGKVFFTTNEPSDAINNANHHQSEDHINSIASSFVDHFPTTSSNNILNAFATPPPSNTVNTNNNNNPSLVQEIAEPIQQQDERCASRNSANSTNDCLNTLYEIAGSDVEEILNNVEVDLGPAEELLLKSNNTTAENKQTAEYLAEPASISAPVEPEQQNRSIVIVEHDTDTEVVLNTRKSDESQLVGTIEPEQQEVLNSLPYSLRKQKDFDNDLFEESDPLSTWKCKHCSKEFDDWIAFQNHQPSHKKVYKCLQCDTIFTTRGNLNVHKRIHTGEKPFICAKCSSRFATSGNLRRHLLTHQGLKPYNCSICNAKFTEKKSLMIHQRSRHTGEKPFKCQECGQGFSQSSILNSHKLIHSNKKPFICKCGHTFRQKSQLRLHESRHAGLKNYSCTHEGCNAAFVTKADMDRHMNSHRGQKLFVCDTCGNSFMRKYTLKKHLISKHPEVEPQP